MNNNSERIQETIFIDGKKYDYIMTSSTEVLKTELEKLGCRLPYYNDYRYNPSLSHDVRRKMAEHKTKWSLTTSNGSGVLNFYKESERENDEGKREDIPFVVYLSELIDFSRSSNLFSKKLIFALNQFDKNKLPALATEWTPLMIAISQRKIEIVRILLDSGLSPNQSDSKGYTPLMLASFLNEANIIQLLINHGADVNAKSRTGFSALIYAIYVNAIESVKVLQKNGADLNLSITPRIIEEKHTFLETLNFYISTFSLGGKGDISLIYKKSGMSKQNFSKIRSKTDPNYRPKKETVLQLIVGLRLTLNQAESLLESAGYLLDENNPVDSIFKEHISHLDFDIIKINNEIFEKTGKAFLKE